MANKKNKKKAQQSAPANNAAANSKVEAKKAVAKKNEKAAKSKKNEKPGFFARTKKYFASVKSEMKRVTWPDKKELVNYSVVVCRFSDRRRRRHRSARCWLWRGSCSVLWIEGLNHV